ncbi:MAG: hypothetical protein NTAFB05_02220 [Nitrobacter sp.]|uniref:hypothetical protein n=1 Tax=Nitrobacter sp. TaxID=29420 RepID=UPI00387DD9D8
MLPGFRFLSVAIVLAVSMLIFGLGAAALLRATHEEFASLPLKQMPEVMFGSREAVEQPTLAVLQVDTPASEPAPDQAEAQRPVTAAPDAQPEPATAAPPAAADTPPAADALSAATDSAAPASSPAPSDSMPKPAADTMPANDAAGAKSSEPPPEVETSVGTGDAAKLQVPKTDAAKSDAPKPDTGASDVSETMTSPLGEHFRPPLPSNRPTQTARTAAPTPPAARRSSAKPPRTIKRHRHRKVHRSVRARPAAPNPAPPSTSPFALD